jgi:hypothetical protein
MYVNHIVLFGLQFRATRLECVPLGGPDRQFLAEIRLISQIVK